METLSIGPKRSTLGYNMPHREATLKFHAADVEALRSYASFLDEKRSKAPRTQREYRKVLYERLGELNRILERIETKGADFRFTLYFCKMPQIGINTVVDEETIIRVALQIAATAGCSEACRSLAVMAKCSLRVDEYRQLPA